MWGFGHDEPPPPRDKRPRHLTSTDVQSFIDASGRRNERAIAADQRAVRVSFLAELEKREPFRIRRMNRDLNWLLKEAAKAGFSPDEVRMMMW